MDFFDRGGVFSLDKPFNGRPFLFPHFETEIFSREIAPEALKNWSKGMMRLFIKPLQTLVKGR